MWSSQPCQHRCTIFEVADTHPRLLGQACPGQAVGRVFGMLRSQLHRTQSSGALRPFVGYPSRRTRSDAEVEGRLKRTTMTTENPTSCGRAVGPDKTGSPLAEEGKPVNRLERFGRAADGVPPLRNQKFADSPLEEDGFELMVPLRWTNLGGLLRATFWHLTVPPSKPTHLAGGRPMLFPRRSRY